MALARSLARSATTDYLEFWISIGGGACSMASTELRPNWNAMRAASQAPDPHSDAPGHDWTIRDRKYD